MHLKYTKIKLIIILLVAAILRLWQLSSVPPHLSPDEAALGYNAFSILNTGRDEHGETFPLIFKSFGDYKPGFYVYLAVPFIKLFGLTEFATRFPSALMGVLAVYLVYHLVKNLKFGLKNIEYYSAFILAISPWHIVFSRGAWEANVALTLTVAGILFFIKSFDNNKNLLLSALFFGLTLITYQGAKLTTIIALLLCLVLYMKQTVKINKKILMSASIVGIVFLVPIIFSFVEGKTGRLSVFSVFAYPRDEQYIENFITEAGVNRNSITYHIFYNEPLNFLRGVMGRYFNHFSGRFLFIEGDWQNPMFSPPYHGMVTLADLILFIGGLYLMLKNLPKKQFSFILLWLLLTPLPAVLSRDQVQAVRALHMVVPLSIVFSLGLWWIVNNKYRILKFGFVVIYLLSYLYFLDSYFVHFPKSRSNLWGYGYKKIVQTVAPLQDNYERIKVEQSYAQPYIYFLFYNAYDPAKYQLQNSFVEGKGGDVGMVSQLDNIYFGPMDNGTDLNTSGVVVTKKDNVPLSSIADQTKYNVIKTIDYPRGSVENGYIIFSVNSDENKQ